jgi:hypothetical protein
LSQDDLTKALQGTAVDPKADAAIHFAKLLLEKRGRISDSRVLQSERLRARQTGKQNEWITEVSGMDELFKTYTLAHSPDGWRLHFSMGIAPGSCMEPHHRLFDVIERVETLYPGTGPVLPLNNSRTISSRGLGAGMRKSFNSHLAGK